MKPQKLIPLKYGSARVDEDCSQETIDMLNKMCEIAHSIDWYKAFCIYSRFYQHYPGQFLLSY